MEYQRHVLPNGIRILHKPIQNGVSHCALMVNTGSRDENNEEQGLAHFIEHTLFKGTQKRKSYHVLSCLENVGGEINAYTTKEETCLYASFLPTYYPRTLELFSDIFFNSTFPENELQKEKDIIVDEINSYRDNPLEEIHDEIEDMVFKNHPLGRNILGTKESVMGFNKPHIQKFMKHNFNTDQMVICSVGNYPFSKLLKLIERHFGSIEANPRRSSRQKFENYQAETKLVQRELFQSHCVMANISYSAHDKNRASMTLLNNILGGPGLNTRLNMGIREKYGFCYNIESNYTSFSDIGIFTLYFGTDPSSLERTTHLVKNELKKLREIKLGSLQLQRAKQQLIGQIAMAQESNVSELLSMAKSLLVFDKVDSIHEVNREIEQITAEDLLAISNECFDEKQFSTLIYNGQK